MQGQSSRPATVDAYIAQFPPDVQQIMQKIRAVIHDAAPGVVEKISYQMPAFQLHGTLVWFGGHQRHIGFYPTASGIAAFQAELAGYQSSKGAVQFPLDQPIPYELIGRIVKFRAAETAHK